MEGGEKGVNEAPPHLTTLSAPRPLTPLLHNRLLAAVGSRRGTQSPDVPTAEWDPTERQVTGRHVDRRQMDTGGGAVADRCGVGVR